WAAIRGRETPPVITESVAIVAVQTRGTAATARETAPGWLTRLMGRRETAAILLAIIVWCMGAFLRPDFWMSLNNSFNLMLAFTEVALLSIGMTYVIANGDIDLSRSEERRVGNEHSPRGWCEYADKQRY